MQLKTILNRVEKHRSFVYGKAEFVETERGPTIEIEIRPRANARAVCSGCEQPGPGYDTLPVRRFEFVPLCGILIFFLYAMRRVDCGTCGVKVEKVPWAKGKQRITTSYAWFLAGWAKRLSWSEVAVVFRTSWDTVFRSVEMAVAWGRANMDMTEITAIGVDEIAWQRGHKYLTLVYQINEGTKRLLWIGESRKAETLQRFFRWLGKERSGLLQFVASDMWKPYLQVIAEKAPDALNVLDRFHVMAHMSKAIDEVRAGEVKQLKADGYEPILKHSRWCLLKRPENLTTSQEVKLADLVRYNVSFRQRCMNRRCPIPTLPTRASAKEDDGHGSSQTGRREARAHALACQQGVAGRAHARGAVGAGRGRRAGPRPLKDGEATRAESFRAEAPSRAKPGGTRLRRAAAERRVCPAHRDRAHDRG